ncbi:glycosyltransferase [Algoriphagus lacus]|uniref:Glycosyltransferase n=1 Tax=Algoriphagus lacus TaxID=2056311 RepID=A0A418PMY4_9BACT|nr:glycosyltransferase [Algoriphagus lacus]RIW13093.1 glycosyltransferase [Algoriphagus lacus]
MKILFTQDALINAGTERSNLELISRFSENLEVSVVYFYPRYELKENYLGAGIRLFFLDIPEKYHLLKGILRLVQLIKKEKPDLLISSLWRADIITRIASMLTGVPLIGTLVNDSYSPIAWTDKKGLKHKFVHWLDRLTAGIPIHWIANANVLADSHVKTLGLNREKISVVYRGRPVPVIARTRYEDEAISQREHSFNEETASAAEDSEVRSNLAVSSLAVTEDVIASDAGAKQSLNDYELSPEETASASNSQEIKLGIQEGSLAVTGPIRNFISYGRLLERKGFQDAIRAFAQVLKTYPDCTLTIFGEGSYRKDLESLIQNLGLNGSVFLPGKIDNPSELLLVQDFGQPKPEIRNPKSFDCFIFPSWYEGFSGALVEAMMAGIPIIASDIPMNLEAVQSGKSALVFPVGNWEAMAERMITAIENPKLMQELGDQARSVSVQKFDIEVIAKQYEALLRKIHQQNQKA